VGNPDVIPGAHRHAAPNVGPEVGRKSFVVGSINVGPSPLGLAVNASNGYVYVANFGAHFVSVLSGLSNISAVSLLYSESNPDSLAFDPNNGNVFVAESFSYVSVIRGTSLVSTTLVPGYSCAPVFDPTNGYVYVATPSYGNVSIFRGTSLIGSFALPSYSCGSAVFDPMNGYLYYSNSTARGTVLVLNGTQVIATVPVGDTPTGLAFDSANGDIYVANEFSWNVSVIHGTSVVASIPISTNVETLPSAVAFDPINGYVYVTNVATNNVSVINGTSVINSFPVGGHPAGAAFDPANGYVYVSNYATNNVSVINGSFFYPGISSFVASPSLVEVNSTTIATTTLIAAATSGQGVLSIAYSGLPPGCASQNVTHLSCTPTQAGTYTVQVYANNSLGYGASTITSLTVVAALQDRPTASPPTTVVGQPVTFSGTPSLGSGTYLVLWRFGDGTFSLAGYVDHVYTSTGEFTARLWANDTYGGALNFTFLVTVHPKPSSPPPSVWPYLESPVVLGGVAAAALVIGVVNLVLYLRRTRPPKPEPTPPSPAGPP